MTAPATHKPQCEGHATCYRCGVQCGKVLQRDEDGCPVVVVCLGCYGRFAIEVEEITS